MSCWQAQAAPSCLLAALLPQGCFLIYVVMLSRLMFVASPTGIMEVKPGKPGRTLEGDQVCAECPPQVLMLLLRFPWDDYFTKNLTDPSLHHWSK